MLGGKLNCCKVFESTKCLQPVFARQRFTISSSQYQGDVEIIGDLYITHQPKCSIDSSHRNLKSL